MRCAAASAAVARLPAGTLFHSYGLRAAGGVLMACGTLHPMRRQSLRDPVARCLQLGRRVSATRAAVGMCCGPQEPLATRARRSSSARHACVRPSQSVPACGCGGSKRGGVRFPRLTSLNPPPRAAWAGSWVASGPQRSGPSSRCSEAFPRFVALPRSKSPSLGPLKFSATRPGSWRPARGPKRRESGGSTRGEWCTGLRQRPTAG